MSEEAELDDDIFEEDEPYRPGEEKGHGPGFRLGLLIGLLVGAVVAVLLAPPTGEEEQAAGPFAAGQAPEVDVDSPLGRISTIIEQVRARVQEASREAEIAAREAEELAHARYAELTHQEKKNGE